MKGSTDDVRVIVAGLLVGLLAVAAPAAQAQPLLWTCYPFSQIYNCCDELV